MLACVVDDEPLVQSALSSLLARRDFEVQSFASAEAFCERAPSDPHILIVDKNLPGMSGIELVTQQRERGAEFEAILITGYADMDSAITAVRLGLYSYLRKPFDMQAFLTDVQGAADRLRRRTERPGPPSSPATGEVLEAIREPLSQTNACLTTLRESLKNAKLSPLALGEQLDAVHAVVQTVEQTVEGQLLIERLDANDGPQLQMELLDLREMIDAVAHQLLEATRHEQKSLVVEATRSMVVKGDRAALEQALRTIVQHALAQVVRRGMVILDLEQRGQEAALQVVAQEIRAEEQSATAKATTERKLDVCQRIAEAHGGRLEISPYLGGIGVQYVLTIPVMEMALDL